MVQGWAKTRVNKARVLAAASNTDGSFLRVVSFKAMRAIAGRHPM